MPTKRWPHLSYAGSPHLSFDGGKFFKPESLGDAKVFRTWDTARWRTQASVLSHPSPNSDTDPVTLTLVLDCLLRLEHDTILRATTLVPVLADNYPQIKWDNVTVGKILSSLYEAAQTAPGIAGKPGIEVAKESNGRNVYGVNLSVEFWQWLGAARTIMGTRAERLMRDERDLGRRIRAVDFPWDVFEEATRMVDEAHGRTEAAS